MFYLEIEDFKRLPNSEFLVSRARKISRKYIFESSKMQVNIDSATYKDLEGRLDNPSPNCFNTAQAVIKELMRKDSFPRFIKTKMYVEMIAALKKREAEVRKIPLYIYAFIFAKAPF